MAVVVLQMFLELMGVFLLNITGRNGGYLLPCLHRLLPSSLYTMTPVQIVGILRISLSDLDEASGTGFAFPCLSCVSTFETFERLVFCHFPTVTVKTRVLRGRHALPSWVLCVKRFVFSHMPSS